MRAYIGRRIIQMLPVLLVAAFAVFSIIHILPGSPALILAGQDATPEQIAEIESRLGLDQPLLVQFMSWLRSAVQGDLGESYVNGVPVADLLASRLPATLQLAAFSIVAVLLLAFPLGIVAALRPDAWYGRAVNGFLALSLATPGFWMGYLLILLFAVQLGWLSAVSDFVPIWEDPIGALRSTLLPALAVGLSASAVTARFLATSLREVLDVDYVRTARAKGVSKWNVIRHHALPNAMLPTVTILGLQVAGLLTGAIVVEVVFTYPGIGRLLFSGVSTRDYAVLQGVLLFVIAVYLFVNVVVDVLYAYLDPRIRLR